ncbi:MAG: M15 family metallopeptidase [Candidatus Pacebacteria bacterium]|nr:M15 family metallopeptidase [Candidatus Paceibacterota bacterium]
MKKSTLLVSSGIILAGIFIGASFYTGGGNLFAILITNADDLLNLINKQNTVEHYAPSDLVELSDLGFKGQYIRAIAYQDLKRLFSDSKKQGLDLKIVSAYRSYTAQKNLFSRYFSKDKNANSYSAEAGHSEHQLGTTIDFGSGEQSVNLKEKFADSAEGKWLAEHSFEYGFMMSYPKGQETNTGYIFEPWHFRFIGTPSAREAHNAGLHLFAFINQKNSVSDKTFASIVDTPTPPLKNQSRIIRAKDNNNIYYINDNGYRHLIPSEDVFLSYGNKWSEIKIMSSKELTAIPETTLITNKGNTNVYKIVDGKKLKIASNLIQKYSADQVSIVSDYEFKSYEIGPDIN